MCRLAAPALNRILASSKIKCPAAAVVGQIYLLLRAHLNSNCFCVSEIKTRRPNSSGLSQCREGNKLETDKKIHQAMMASINRNSFAANYISAAIDVIYYVIKILRNPVKMELMLSTFPLAMEPVFKFPRQCPMHAFHCDGHDNKNFV